MGWFAVSPLRREGAPPPGNAALRDALARVSHVPDLLERGTLLIELSCTIPNRPVRLFDLDYSHPRPGRLTLSLVPGDAVMAVQQQGQGQEAQHMLVNYARSTQPQVLRVTLTWDCSIGFARLWAETPDQEFRLILMRAELLNGRKQYAQAFDLLTEALVKSPGQKELLYTRALVAEHLDRLDILEEDLTTILKTHPNDASVLNALGYTLADRTDRLEEAEKYLLRAIELQPDMPVIIDSYGWLLYRQGKLEKALEYLKKAFAKEKEPEIAGHVVEVLWSLNRKSEARKIFIDAINKDPNDEYLLRLKQEINGLVKD